MPKERIAIFNAIDGKFRIFEQFPVILGSDQASDWQLDNIVGFSRLVTLSKTSKSVQLTPDPQASLLLDSAPLRSAVSLKQGEDYALTLGENFLILRYGLDVEPWANGINLSNWTIYTAKDASAIATLPVESLRDHLKISQYPAGSVLAAPDGVAAGFDVYQVAAEFDHVLLNGVHDQNFKDDIEIDNTYQNNALLDADMTCPVCWLGFGAGDVMAIATHDHLRGDPVLGPDAKLRFTPTRFNDMGQALDSMGLPCLDSACPHCRRKLPPGFLDLPSHIVSIVGAPSAGKSYFVCTLIKQLTSALYREFKVTFKDGDPSGNAQLNAMKNQLFSAQTPDEAFLLKTVLEGIMYERLPRHGREVALPRPFVYEISTLASTDDTRSLIFYDNAGEHFKPNISLDDSPGALHVASSDAILFLIDPTTHPAFRARLRGQGDPQLNYSVIDEQDTIMAEMGVRIRTVKGLNPRERSKIPLAVILGKCDVWEHLLPGSPLERPIREGRLDLRIMDDTSQRIRELLLDIDPSLVAVADSVSQEVVFFPVSSFGHTPVPIVGGPHEGKFAPDPAKLSPRFVEIPLVWAISKFAPNLIPVTP